MNQDALKQACDTLGWKYKLENNVLYVTDAKQSSEMYGEYVLKVAGDTVTYNSYYLDNGQQLIEELQETFFPLNVEYAKKSVVDAFSSNGFTFQRICRYVKKENVVTGKKAKEVLIEAKDVIVKVKAKKTELRSEDNKKSKVLSNLQEKAEYPITDISKDKKWIKVERTSTMSGWVKTKDVTVKIHKEYLYTPEEYDDMLEQEWAANAITYTLEETSLPKEGEAAEFLKYATQFLGNRYVWGGTSLTSGADCSGFTMSLFKNFGYSLSRTAAEQAHNGKAVKSNKLKPGDLVFYHTDRKNKNRISHVAIYIGDGKILHSANKTQGVIISRLGNPCAARRILSGKSVKKDNDKDKEKTAVVSTKKDIKRLNQETTTEEESSTVEIEKTTQVPNTTEVETTTKVEETESCTDE